LRLDKGIESFERQTLNVDVAIVSESDTLARFLKTVVPLAQAEPWLRKQLLVRSDKPVVAGVLLFADEPQAILPKQSAIKIYRYKTAGEGTRETLAGVPLTIEGSLYEQIKAGVSKTVELIEGIQKLGPRGLPCR
jgi:ATP-dependent DNA helicase RecG